ncbi:MAG: RNA polymerase sigma factor [Oscillospiraceae bacterium]|nr:RNA polymerase sigma factor [Oscillospiraceae bacterium]
MDDSRIIELFFERSEQAIAELSRKYGVIIKKLSENILRDKQDAEECVNDTYFDVWNAIPPQRPSSLTALVCRIARNISLDRFRYNSSQKRGAYTVCLDELAECVSSKETVESQFAADELKRLVEKYLDTLDKTNRLIFVRRYWYIDSTKDIAEAAGLNEGAVRTRLARLRVKLKEFLEERGVDV